MLVLLGQGVIQQSAARELEHILRHLQDDDALDHTLALAAVLTTATHLFARFRCYEVFPAKLWTLTRRFNSIGWVTKCEEFLRLPKSELDQGYSQRLQEEALARGTDYAALAHLTSTQVCGRVSGFK